MWILSTTSAKAVIPKLDKIFSAYGIPKVVRSDNGPPFNGSEFEQFAKSYGFKHRKVTPAWPEANGEVERFMRTINKLVKVSSNWKQRLYEFLRNYRATPHSTTNIPPATAMFGRPIRIKLPDTGLYDDCSKLDSTIRTNDQQRKADMKEYADVKRKTSNVDIKVDDVVLVKQPRLSKESTPYSSVPLKVIDRKFDMVSAEANGRIVTRNVACFKKVLPGSLKEGSSVGTSGDIQGEPSVTPQALPNVLQSPVRRVQHKRSPSRQWRLNFPFGDLKYK